MKKMLNLVRCRSGVSMTLALLFWVSTCVVVDARSPKALLQSTDNDRESFIAIVGPRLDAQTRQNEAALQREFLTNKGQAQQTRQALDRLTLQDALLNQQIQDTNNTIQLIRSLTQPGNQAVAARLTALQNSNNAYYQTRRRLSQDIQRFSTALRQQEAAAAGSEQRYRNAQQNNARQGEILLCSVSKYRANRTQSNWLTLLSNFIQLSNQQQVNCAVTVSVNRQPGLVVKFRREGETQANTFNAASMRLGVGFYNFWVERNGQPASNRDRVYLIAQPNETISISLN